MKARLIPLFIILFTNLYSEESYTLLLKINNLSAERDSILLESYSILQSAFSASSLNMKKVDSPESIADLILKGLDLQAPLIMFATIELIEGFYQIESVLIHSVDGQIIEQAQSRGSSDLGFERKWKFIAEKFIKAAQAYSIRSPIKSEYDPEPELVPIAESVEVAEIVKHVEERIEDEELQIERKSIFSLHSFDTEIPFLFPLGRLANYTDWSLGGQISLQGQFSRMPLRIGLFLGVTNEFNINPYINTLIHLTLQLEISYSFSLVRDYLELSPGISVGGLGQFVWGDFNTLNQVDFVFYLDQYYGLFTELAYYPSSSSGHWGILFKPSFFLFPSAEQVGIKVGASIGVRYRFLNGGNL